ncbi:hypothetical protein [Nocardia amikacinitolerans]
MELRPDVLYVEDGNILTSAGLSAGIDLCLHLVRTDYGAATANSAARLVVAAPVRPGGQAQFIRTPLPPETGTSLAATRSWALGRLHEPLTRAALANHARTSIRTLTRKFHAETGLGPPALAAPSARHPGPGAAGNDRLADGPGRSPQRTRDDGLAAPTSFATDRTDAECVSRRVHPAPGSDLQRHHYGVAVAGRAELTDSLLQVR